MDSQHETSRQGAGFLWLQDSSLRSIYQEEKNTLGEVSAGGTNRRQKGVISLDWWLYLVALVSVSKPVTHSCAQMESFSLEGLGFGD